MRSFRRGRVLLAGVGAAVALGTLVGRVDIRDRPASRERRLARVRTDRRQQPLLAADGDHATERRPARPRLHGRLPAGRSRYAPGAAVLSARDRRQPLRDDERRERVRDRRRHGQDPLAAEADEQRGVQELRRRREPRARVLRREAVHPPARHEGVALRPSDGQVVGELAISQDVAERHRGLRLLGDERADLRERQADLRCGRLRARQPRLRDGVHDRPEAGLADAVLDDPAGHAVLAARVADRRRRPGLDAGHDRHDDEHRLLRDRIGYAGVLPVAATRQQSPRGVADRGRPSHRQAQVVAAADRARPVGVRRRPAAARLRRQVGGKTAAGRLRRHQGGPLVRVRRPHGQAVPPARQGARPGRAPAAPPGPAGRRLSGLDRGTQLLARGLRPGDELRLQRRGRDGRRADPGQADADPEEAQVPPRRHLPRVSQNGNFGEYLPSWKDHGSVSAIDVSTGTARVEVRHAGAGARRRHR